jgi:hypothetical protein
MLTSTVLYGRGTTSGDIIDSTFDTKSMPGHVDDVCTDRCMLDTCLCFLVLSSLYAQVCCMGEGALAQHGHAKLGLLEFSSISRRRRQSSNETA